MKFLQNFTVLDTKHLNEAREIIGRSFCAHKLEVLKNRNRFHVEHCATSGHLITLNHLSYGETVLIEPGELEKFYLIQIPLCGHAEIRNGGQVFDSDIQKAAILNPDRHTKMIWHAQCQQLMVYIEKDVVKNIAQEYLGRHFDFDIVFHPELDCERPEITSWRNAILTLAKAADRGELFGQSCSLSQRLYEEEIIIDLLRNQPSNIHCFVKQKQPSVTPKKVKMAFEYIIDNATNPISVADIASAVDIPVRTLQHQFSRSYGLSPIEILKQERLYRVFHELNSGWQEGSILMVASKWGFAHMGRFSKYYKTAFSETPSQTKARAILARKIH